jgi:hypothetical protein
MLGHVAFYNAEVVSNVLVCPVVIYFVVFGDNKLIILTGNDREDHVHSLVCHQGVSGVVI